LILLFVIQCLNQI